MKKTALIIRNQINKFLDNVAEMENGEIADDATPEDDEVGINLGKDPDPFFLDELSHFLREKNALLIRGLQFKGKTKI